MERHAAKGQQSMKAAIQRLNTAYAELSAARAQLAAASIVGPQAPALHAAHEVLAEHRAALLNTPGVVGVGLGVDAARSPTISVFVRSEAGARGTDALRTMLVARRGKSEAIGVEIVEFGELALPPPPPPAAALRGDLGLPKGAVGLRLSPGDGIGAIAPATLATVGAFALAPDDAPVAITAMHVVGETIVEIRPGDTEISIVSRADLDSACGPLIGKIDRGTRTGVDAARVRLAPGVTPNWKVPTTRGIRGWRWPVYPGDIGAGGCLVGARSCRLDGSIAYIDVDFPEFSLERTLVVSIPTEHGDSGSALIDSDGYVLGFLVGASSNLDRSLRLFSPAGLVLSSLDCNIPS